MIEGNNPGGSKTAVLYRMVMPEHTCPYGLKIERPSQTQRLRH